MNVQGVTKITALVEISVLVPEGRQEIFSAYLHGV
jgi:hypothetical protein